MKYLPTIILIIILNQFVFSQKDINNKNYYKYYSNGKNLKGTQMVTAWLNELEAAPIIYDEMKKMGFEWLSWFQIIKIDSSHLVVPACYSEKSKFGFLFDGIHGIQPLPDCQNSMSISQSTSGVEYTEKVTQPNGESKFIKITTLPKNLYLLKCDCYWYQKTDNTEDNKKLITRNDIENILRQDVRDILKKQEDPSKIFDPPYIKKYNINLKSKSMQYSLQNITGFLTLGLYIDNEKLVGYEIKRMTLSNNQSSYKFNCFDDEDCNKYNDYINFKKELDAYLSNELVIKSLIKNPGKDNYIEFVNVNK